MTPSKKKDPEVPEWFKPVELSLEDLNRICSLTDVGIRVGGTIPNDPKVRLIQYVLWLHQGLSDVRLKSTKALEQSTKRCTRMLAPTHPYLAPPCGDCTACGFLKMLRIANETPKEKP